MKLNLEKPILFIDIETTGMNIVTDRIVEISALKIEPDGKEIILTHRVNPEIPIPKDATAIHGITDEDVQDKPVFKEIAESLVKFIAGCDIAGFNSNKFDIKFDIPLLAEEFIRAEIDIDLKSSRHIDVMVIFHKLEQRTLSAAYKFYCGLELENAHSSNADTYATYEILKAQLDKYKDLQNEVGYLNEFSAHTRNVDYVGRIIYNEDGIETFNFGKYKGMTVADVLKKDPSYYSWMIKGEFPLYTKKVLTEIKLKASQK
ncbi:MAG: 3'-5' exonuclease [Bacteroidia bacterium]|nr:3'-5' exonuclease [Bacteroidia bacterium]